MSLTGPYGRRLERGATAAIVAVLLGGGVLLGMSALAIDVGNLMFERRQLQNGADATAMKLAFACADDLLECDDDERAASLTTMASANALDGESQLDRRVYPEGQCGRVAGAPDMPECDSIDDDADLADLGQCPPLPEWLKGATVDYVETYTLTFNNGNSRLAPFFAAGAGTEVSSCARAAWGPPKAASTLPLTFAECEYLEAINTVGFGSDPVDPADMYKGETALPLKYKSGYSCDPTTVPSGGDFSGGFGWLSTTDCAAETTIPHWFDGQTGVGGGSGCYDLFAPGKTVYIPIFTCISDSDTGDDDPCTPGSPSGTHTNYYIDGYAAFYVTGVDITGKAAFLDGYPGSSASTDCTSTSKDNKCIYGWFLSDYVDYDAEIDTSGDGTDYGVDVIQLAG